MVSSIKNQWQFWIDRGGTFTDIVAKPPKGVLRTKKLLSENPEAYEDAALHGIRQFLGLNKTAPIPSEIIKSIKMGTTIATNALLEKQGDATLLLITEGLQDIIEIGHQARPDIFALNIKKSDLLYDKIIGVEERVLASGKTETPLNLIGIKKQLDQAFAEGFRSASIVLMHAYKYSAHEKEIAKIAKKIGFTQISASHDVSPLAKIVPRGETAIVDAYLTPVLRRYIDRIASATQGHYASGKILFMQSSGGLVDGRKFRGRDAILSGPAGGIVGAVHTAKLAGFNKIIGFDMGGTSTDVTHYAGEFEKTYETEVAGVRMRVPMMNIHTIAAGGGSLLRFEEGRFRVGPQSAGANPGPVCYRRGGSLAVTDINVCLGKIQPDFFPALFGSNQDQYLDRDAAVEAFGKIAAKTNNNQSAEDIAEGFLNIAVEHMVQAIKKISIARGYDVKDYVLNCFGGAGGQHACLVAERLGINIIFLHPLSGVLSAYGMGLADIRTEGQKMLEQALNSDVLKEVKHHVKKLTADNISNLLEQGVEEAEMSHQSFALLKYKAAETAFKLPISTAMEMRRDFEDIHKRQYGFIDSKKQIIIETIITESFGGKDEHEEKATKIIPAAKPAPETMRKIYFKGQWYDAPIYKIETLKYGHILQGPALIIEPTGTIVIEKEWTGRLNKYRHIILEKNISEIKQGEVSSTKSSINCDPVTLEIFNNLFMSTAQQMGIVLQNTSQSVNVKERLDFSCAIFDHQGNLIANAPHVPVHLGSMDGAIKVLLQSEQKINPEDVFIHNNPYNGGSHLPDITVISPIFNSAKDKVLFFVASRAHHEDIGGIAPGSMSPLGKSFHEEGIVFDCVKLVDKGVFQARKVDEMLSAEPYPARNIRQNIADLMAQIAANKTGENELIKLVAHYGFDIVNAYMTYIQDNAENSVRSVIATLKDAEFNYSLDEGVQVSVKFSIDQQRREATIDFTGTSAQLPNNFNAPVTVTQAAVLYVFRCLVDDDIPLNAGCLKPLKIIVPQGSMLNPCLPAAVVAGNVETSQAVTNALFGALGTLAASQGTMNNLTFGNERYQYYETICSGSPAGAGFDGAAAVHTHMTNTRLTDPEILESRYPVVLTSFTIDRHSGGKGKWNSGDGVTRSIKFLESMSCSILSGHREVPPFGLNGGKAGRIGKNWLICREGHVKDLKGCAQIDVRSGDIINIRTPTGGGFGTSD